MNTHRITPIAGSMWFWRGIAALEALLLAAAVAIGLAGQLPISRAPAPAAAPAASVSAPAAVVQKGLIACKPCREEVLAATQAQLSSLTAAPARVSAPATAARKPLIACGPCRAEVLAEAQTQLSASAPRTAYASGGVLEEQQVDPRGTGPR